MGKDVTMLNLLALSENTYINDQFCIILCVFVEVMPYHWGKSSDSPAGRSPKMRKIV